MGKLTLGATLGALMNSRLRGAAPAGQSSGYGPLFPAIDQTTGLPLIQLPKGFRYSTFGWTNDPLADGAPTPGSHDGMAVVSRVGQTRTLAIVRNHEVRGVSTPFGTPDITYDAKGAGGTTTLLFDTMTGQWDSAAVSIAGTSTNCAGGPTPWGSWLTCEETLDDEDNGFDKSHGWVFEVPGVAVAHPVALTDLGRFSHEAVAVDPSTGSVYETEDDRYTSGFYRMRPNIPLKRYGLEKGGVLEMLKVKGADNADLQHAVTGQVFDVEWVVVDDPSAPPQDGVGPFGDYDGETSSASGPFLQGYAKGGARFRRLEGCFHHEGVIYFTDTEGGPIAVDTGESEGSVWCYDPAREQLTVIYASPAESIADNPDNITVSPRGGILLCEDGDRTGLRLLGLDPSGDVYNFAVNDIILNGEKGFEGDFRGFEWAGATFDPSGRWLFANIQTPGITFAITGPWWRGSL